MDQQIQRSEIALRMALRNEGYKYRNANLLSLFFFNTCTQWVFDPQPTLYPGISKERCAI